MSWHAFLTQTSTLPTYWQYQAHLVAPMSLVLEYNLAPLYIMISCLAKKSKPPE